MNAMQYGILGQTAPELTIDRWIDGNGNHSKPFLLENHPNTVRLMYCFQSWCPGCHSAGFPTLQALLTHFSDALLAQQLHACVIQTVFEGHSSNTYEQLLTTQQRYQLTIPFAQDDAKPRPSTMTNYRTGGTPWFILINKQQQVIFNDFHWDINTAIETISQQLNDTSIPNTDTPTKQYHAIHQADLNRFIVPFNDQLHGFVSYSQKGNVLFLEHAEVPHSLRGKNYGATLMEAVLESIEEEGFKVVPICTFIQSYLRRYKRWQHLLHDAG